MYVNANKQRTIDNIEYFLRTQLLLLKRTEEERERCQRAYWDVRYEKYHNLELLKQEYIRQFEQIKRQIDEAF